jgi:hypothetical protein
MASVKRITSFYFLIIVFQLFLSIIAISSFAQTKPSYRNHEEIDVGGGMKVEILKCYGEGPTEECDCIYFTDKRQTGTRMKQNANRLKEEERAANLARGITTPVSRTSGSSTNVAADNRTDKAIPASIAPNPLVKATPRKPTLEEAVKRADSVARASSEKMKEGLSKTSAADDSTEMDKVYIPKVTETGATRFEASNTISANITSRDTATQGVQKDTNVAVASYSAQSSYGLVLDTVLRLDERKQDAGIAPSPAAVANKPVRDTIAAGVQKDTVVSVASAQVIASTSSDSVVEAAETTKSITVIKTPPVNNSVSSDTITKTTIKSAGDLATSPVNSVSNTAIDTTENNWVKQYQQVKPGLSINEPLVSKPHQDEVNNEKITDTSSTLNANAGAVKKDAVTNAPNATVNSDDATTAPQPDIESNKSAVSNLIGKSAEVNTKGDWEKATIIDKETEFLYKVHYLGRTSEHDEWVSVTQIRNIDSAAVAEIKRVTENPSKISKVNTGCSFEAPAPPVSNGDKFSEKLAKRKIYEGYVNANKGNGVKKTGITFLSLTTETPYVNTVSVSAANVLEIKFAFAPAGAMIYPVKTQFKVCEQALGKNFSKTLNSYYGCFRNKTGAWACAVVE